MDNDERQRSAVSARIEFDQHDAAFNAVNDALIAQLQNVKTENDAYRIAMSLQVLKSVRDQVLAKAQDLEVMKFEQETQEALNS